VIREETTHDRGWKRGGREREQHFPQWPLRLFLFTIRDMIRTIVPSLTPRLFALLFRGKKSKQNRTNDRRTDLIIITTNSLANSPRWSLAYYSLSSKQTIVVSNLIVPTMLLIHSWEQSRTETNSIQAEKQQFYTINCPTVSSIHRERRIQYKDLFFAKKKEHRRKKGIKARINHNTRVSNYVMDAAWLNIEVLNSPLKIYLHSWPAAIFRIRRKHFVGYSCGMRSYDSFHDPSLRLWVLPGSRGACYAWGQICLFM